MDEGTRSLFSKDESKAITSSWATITSNGLTPVGQLVLQRLFQDVPEVLPLFYQIGIDKATGEELSLVNLSKSSQFNSHAKRVATGIDEIVNNIDDTATVTDKCVKLGRRHRKHNVQPQYFDMLGGVLLKVISQTMKIEETNPTIKAWAKAYGVIAAGLKDGLAEGTQI